MAANFDDDNRSAAHAYDTMGASLEHYRAFRVALLKLDNGAGSFDEVENSVAFFANNPVRTAQDALAYSALARTFYLRAAESAARGDPTENTMTILNVAEEAMDKMMAFMTDATGKPLPQSTDIQRALN
ncbi:MAG: hypothetical protein J0I23_25925 [Rhizobiales bacterium]|nr:hypothetical protein [Hyphomicrobiales bacterium]